MQSQNYFDVKKSNADRWRFAVWETNYYDLLRNVNWQNNDNNG